MDVVKIAHGEVCSDVPPTVAMRMIQTVSNVSLTGETYTVAKSYPEAPECV